MAELSEKSKAFEYYLKSISGVFNPIKYKNPPPITSRIFFNVGDGWLPLIQDLIEQLIALGWNKEIVSVISCSNGLRFDIVDGTFEMYDVINQYTLKSFHICEKCGHHKNSYINKGENCKCDDKTKCIH